jgi:hypothetical protein
VPRRGLTIGLDGQRWGTRPGGHMYIGAGTIIVILLIVVIVMMLRR